MKAKITMIVETNKQCEDFELESHLRDALTEYTGNEIEFTDCKIEEIICSLKMFDRNLREVICLETFTAGHTNSIVGKIERGTKTFTKGEIYQTCSWRPEGITVDNFFVFHKNASKFARIS